MIGLLIAPALIEWLNWEAVFYIFGALGLVWCVFLQAPSAPLHPPPPTLPPVYPSTPVPSLPVRKAKLGKIRQGAVPPASEEVVEQMLAQAGFVQPKRFFSSLFWCAWIAAKA